MDKPPFDPVKACFYLIAAVLAFQGLVAFTGLMWCVYWSRHIVEGNYDCKNIGHVMNQLLQAALTAALAFTAGFTRRDK